MLLHLLPLSCPAPPFHLRGGTGGSPRVRAGGWARTRALRGTDVEPETPPMATIRARMGVVGTPGRCWRRSGGFCSPRRRRRRREPRTSWSRDSSQSVGPSSSSASPHSCSATWTAYVSLLGHPCSLHFLLRIAGLHDMMIVPHKATTDQASRMHLLESGTNS
jgi:hypothetical protein